MNSFDLFNVLPYAIPEDLFKQKIGTGDSLTYLQEKGYVHRTNEGICVDKSFLQEHVVPLSKDENEKLHLDIIESFYIPKLKNVKIIDYEDLIKYYNFYINLAYHYMEISKFDDAIHQIGCIAKKMQYWGLKEVLIDSLNKFSNESLNEESLFLKTYYELFSRILSFSDNEYDISEFESKFKFLEKTKERNFLLYLEFKNLEGIFWRICEKDTEKAIQLHLETLRLIENQQRSKDDNNSIGGRIYENLSFCYQQLNKSEKAEESIEKAQKYFVDDPYELTKIYFYKASFKYKKQSKELLWVTQFKELSIYLEKYKFPDIERNLCNLLSEIEIKKSKQFENFFKFKLRALDCDLVLYREYFATDFISIYKVILENKDQYKEQIVDGLKYLSSFLQKNDLEDETIFIELIKAYLKKEEYLNIKKKISNQSLVNLFDVFIEK